MQRNYRRYLQIIGTTLLLCVAGCLCVEYVDYHSKLSTTMEWARLAPFPGSAREFHVETRGSKFTREFVVRFQAPLAEIKDWLERSPGTAGVQPTQSGFLRKYAIQPGGGAQHAELEFDEQTGTVKIHVFWS